MCGHWGTYCEGFVSVVPISVIGVHVEALSNNSDPDCSPPEPPDRCILYQLVYGAPPFHSLNLTQKIRAITNKKWKIPYPPTGAAAQDPSLVTVMRRCLQFQPELRPPIFGTNGLLVTSPADETAFTLAPSQPQQQASNAMQVCTIAIDTDDRGTGLRLLFMSPGRQR